MKKQQQQNEKNPEQQQQPNTSNKAQQQQQQPPKLTIRSRGIEISDMKQYLARKKKDRAALLGGKNSDIKAKSAVAHTQPITNFLNSAHTEALDGITG